MRVNVLFGAFALVFFPVALFAAGWPGDCQIVTGTAYNETTTTTTTLYVSTALNYNSSTGTFGTPTQTIKPEGTSLRKYSFNSWYIDSGSTWLNRSGTVKDYYLDGISLSGIVMVPEGVNHQDYINQHYPTCSDLPCDTGDNDNDGVCNQCDQNQGQPDPQDCLRGITTNAAGETTGALIDKGCSGNNPEWWQGDNYTSGDRFIAQIGDDSENKGQLNCNENCNTSDPCSYGSSGLDAVVGSLSPASPQTIPIDQEILDSLLDLPSPDQMPKRCDGHNQQCKEYCEDKLGVGMSYCYEKDGKKKSNCVCNNNFAYDMVTDSDTPAKEQADINKDSNNSGVPDYADDSILNQGDSDSDGITDKADVDNTGGQDSNGDGIDDAYTANAQASANAAAGLSKSDSLNLDSIATSTAQTSAATQGLKTGIDKISDNTADLIARADASIALSQDLRDKLNTFSEEGTASLATQQGQLVDGLFPGIQPGDIPDDPTKNFDVDAFVQEFSFAFPDEVKTIIEGSSLQVQNPDSCVTGEIMGQQVQFCFDRFQAVFLAMGLLFKGLCVWRAIEIIAVGVRA